MTEPMDPNPSKTYRLPLSARFGRWWKKWGEGIALIVLSGCAALSLFAFLAGEPGTGALIALGGLLFLVYAYANWYKR